MNARTLLVVPALSVLIGCQSVQAPTPSPAAMPSPTPASGAQGLVADLDAQGAEAKVGSAFMSEPIGGQGMTVCVDAETIQVYEFIDHEAALATTFKIDRDEPSHVGNGIVEWNGRPRFWLRDRMIVLYLGEDAGVDAALHNLLGPPFAEGRDRGRGLLPNLPCQ
jgi:hypothetical protein